MWVTDFGEDADFPLTIVLCCISPLVNNLRDVNHVSNQETQWVSGVDLYLSQKTITSPRKLSIFITQKSIFRMKVSKKTFNLLFTTASPRTYRVQ